jgi:hypothetical protein
MLIGHFRQATTPIDDPAFIQVWNLLDIISIFSDNGSLCPLCLSVTVTSLSNTLHSSRTM